MKYRRASLKITLSKAIFGAKYDFPCCHLMAMFVPSDPLGNNKILYLGLGIDEYAQHAFAGECSTGGVAFHRRWSFPMKGNLLTDRCSYESDVEPHLYISAYFYPEE